MYSKIEMPKKKHVDYIIGLVFFSTIMVVLYSRSSFSFQYMVCACVGDEEHVRKQEKRARKKVMCKNTCRPEATTTTAAAR
jgi:hypothetical protein